MAKSLKDILNGVKSSKKETPDLSDIHDYGKDAGKEFISKHEIEKHEDRVGNDDDVYKGKTKQAKYKGVKEETQIDELSREKVMDYRKKQMAANKASHERSKETGEPVVLRRGAGNALNKLNGWAKVNATDNKIEESNKENKAKKKKVMATQTKEKSESHFDPREMISALKRGRVDESSCNKSPAGTHCEMHGEDDCSGSMEKKKGKKLLLDKDKKED